MYIMDKVKKFFDWWVLWKIINDDIKNNKKFMGWVVYLKYNFDILFFLDKKCFNDNFKICIYF